MPTQNVIVVQSNTGIVTKYTNAASVVISSVAQNSSLLVISSFSASHPVTPPNFIVTDNVSHSYSDVLGGTITSIGSQNNWSCLGYALTQNVNAGNYLITSVANNATVNTSGPASVAGFVTVIEIQNLAPGPLDVYSTATGSNFIVGNTANVTQNTDVAFASFCSLTTTNFTGYFSPPAAGYVNLYQFANGQTYHVITRTDYLVPSGDGNQNATWQTGGSGATAAAIIALKAAPIASNNVQPLVNISLAAATVNVMSYANTTNNDSLTYSIPSESISVAIDYTANNYDFNVTIGAGTTKINVAEITVSSVPNTVTNTYIHTIRSVDNSFPTVNVSTPFYTLF